MALAKASDHAPSGFFKPKEYLTSLGLLVEPKSIQRDVPNTYKNKTTHRNEIKADISVFDNQAAIDERKPTKVLHNVTIGHGMLVRNLEGVIGDALVAKLDMVETRAGEGYAFRDPDDATYAAIEEFYEKREADVKTALNDAPSFD